MKFSTLILSVAFQTAALAGNCPRDNLLRCLVGTSAVAVPYCTSQLSLSAATHTVSTYTPVKTVTSVLWKTKTSLTTITKAKTTVPAAAKVPRAITTVIPKCVAATYLPASISSACSCFLAEVSYSATTVIVTATASTTTSVVYRTISTTKTATATLTQTSAAAPIPTGNFTVKAVVEQYVSPVDPLRGFLRQDYLIGLYDRDEAQTPLVFHIEPGTGHLGVSAPQQLYWFEDSGPFFVVVDPTSQFHEGDMFSHTALPAGDFRKYVVCSIARDANGEYPITCDAGNNRTQFTAIISPVSVTYSLISPLAGHAITKWYAEFQ